MPHDALRGNRGRHAVAVMDALPAGEQKRESDRGGDVAGVGGESQGDARTLRSGKSGNWLKTKNSAFARTWCVEGNVGDALGTGQIITALTGVGGVLVGSLISWGVQASLLGRRIAADKILATDKFEFDKKLAEKRFRYDRELAERKFAQEREQLVFSGSSSLQRAYWQMPIVFVVSSATRALVVRSAERERLGNQRRRNHSK
jgi:hypothetical protein